MDCGIIYDDKILIKESYFNYTDKQLEEIEITIDKMIKDCCSGTGVGAVLLTSALILGASTQ